VLTVVFTMLMSNTAAAVLMFPVAIDAAAGAGLAPLPVAVIVAVTLPVAAVTEATRPDWALRLPSTSVPAETSPIEVEAALASHPGLREAAVTDIEVKEDARLVMAFYTGAVPLDPAAISRQLAAEGCAILYISHKLEEVKALCETATILRGGKVVANCDPRAGQTKTTTTRRHFPATRPNRLPRPWTKKQRAKHHLHPEAGDL